MKILIIEDHEDLRAASIEVFTETGFEVIAAIDGAEALEITQNHRFDMILSDVLMPKMDGMQFLKKYRLTDPRTPVFIFSAFSPYSKDEFKAAGANDIFEKPCDFYALARHLKLRVKNAA